MSIGVERIIANRTDIDAELQKHKSPITVMFTDLAGSTSFFEKFGDTVGVAWLEEHNQIVIPKLKEFDGVLVKTIGDSVMAYFSDAKQAIRAGAAMQRSLHAANANKDDKERMYVRVALHHGLGYLRGGDIFGDVVNVAARIAKSCLPGQILISEAVYVSTHDATDLNIQSVGAVQFHGKSSKENLYEVLWTDEDTYQQLRQKFPPKKESSHEDITGGRYIMMNELGRGAMGVVYKAYDRLIGRPVALKTIPLEVDQAERGALVDRLKAEARTAGILDHPNIVTVFDVGEEAGLFYFTMQLVDGRTLAEIKESKDLLPLDKLFTMADEMCSALAFAHKGSVVHRDIKPSNIMVTSQGNIKIMDFGIAKLGDSGLTKAGMVLGTPSYLAPEQAAGRRIDQRADIFSLGAVLYELFTGEKAFAGESTTAIIYKVMNDDPIPPRVIEPSLPPGLDSVIKKAIAKDPQQRYQNCDELREALRHARTGVFGQQQPTVATQVRTASIADATQPIPVPTSANKGLWIGAAAAVMVLSIAGFALWQKRPEPAPTNAAEAPQATAPVAAKVDGTPVKDQPIVKASAQPVAPVTKSPEIQPAENQRPLLRPRVARALQRAAATEQSQAAPVEGGGQMWSAQDVPNLLGKANMYAGRGDYQKAIFLYEQILRIDSRNQNARDGLQRAREARNLRR
ncbi:MAG TPA: protein kinase [Terriglobales bacterium]|nr:protein kinase [Terriglobales bacterium]